MEAMKEHFGWVEMVLVGTFGLGFGVWQLWSVNREIARDKQAKDRAAADSAAGAGHSVGEHELDDR